MKKITLIFTLLLATIFSWQSNAQTICTQSFTISGNDGDPTVMAIVPADITCNNGELINSITIVNTAISDGFCAADGSNWYNFTLNIDGVDVLTGCNADFDNYAVPATFTSLSITSTDTDNYATDSVTIAFDLEIDHATPSCQAPTGVAVSAIGTTQATVSWTEPNMTVPAAEYVAVLTGSPAPTGAGTTLTNGGMISGLTAATIYDLYVRDDCGGSDFSAWADLVTFTTACDPFSDFIENFDSTTDGDLATCWSSKVTSTDASADVVVNSGQVEFSNGADTDSASEFILVTPQLTDLPSDTHRIRFMASGPTGTALQIGTMDSPTGVFTPIGGFALSPTMAEYAFSFTASTTNQYVALKAVLSVAANSTVVVDDFNWEPTPGCVEPTNLFVNNITSSSADISWTEVNTTPATVWDLYIVPTGDAAPDAASIPTENDIANPYTFSATANTAYDVYVRADCDQDNTGVSTWVGPQIFTTTCATFTFPYTEDFEDAGDVDGCWTQDTNDDLDWSANMGSTISSSTGPSSANSGDYYIYVESSGSAIGNTAVIYSPMIDLTGAITPRLNFAYHMYGDGMVPDGTIDVAISTDGGTTYVSIFNEVDDHGDQWNSGIVDLSAYSGIISFRVSTMNGQGTTYHNDFAIDDFKVEETPAAAPSCAVVVATDVDANCGDRGVDLNWDAVVGAEGYRVTVGTTTGGNDIADNVDLGSGLAYNFPSTPATDYFYTLIPYNAIGDATGCTEATFTSFATGCICESVPTSNDGNGVANVQIVATDFPSLGDVTYEDNTGGTVVDLEQVLTNNLQITFEAGATYGTNIWIDMNDDNVLDNATELFFSGASLGANPTTLDASFVIPLGANEGVHTMRIGTADFGQATPTPCYNGSWGVTLDFKVNILPPPACLPPSALAIADITDISATLSWTTGGSGESLYDIEVVDITTGGTVTGTATYTDQANPYSLTGLAESNDYEYYVKANCTADGYSIWVGPFAFSTVASCITPTDVMVSNIDSAAGTADLSWTDNNSTAPANGWEYEIVDITASATPTGTGVAATTNPVSLAALVAGNQYEVLVRAVCGAAGSESGWSTAYAWTQMDVPGCVTNPMPADVATDIALGMTTFTWDVPTGTVVSYDVYGGDSTTTLVLLGNVTTPSYDYTINASGTTYFWQVIAKNAGGEAVGCSVWSFTSIAPPGCGEVFTDVNGAAADYSSNENFTWTLTPNTAGEVVTVIFTSFNTEQGWDGLMVYDGPDNTFPLIDSGSTYNRTTCPNGAWMGDSTNASNIYVPTSFSSSDASGALTFVFTSDNSGTRLGWEADITCAAPPVCADPTNLAASNMTDLTADLSWDENGMPPATAWDIEWGTTGFAQGAGTMVSNTMDNPYMLSGLTASTDYDFYVKSKCAAPYESAWAGPFTFTTLATPTCLVPTNLTATNITDVSADLGWTEANTTAASAWDIEWGTAGFTQGAGTMITATANNPESISGLMAVTDYEFYVRAICSASDSSTWAGPFVFTTAPTPPANDDCVNAILLTVTVDFATGMLTGTNVGATDSGETAPGCAYYQGGDVWYSVVVPSDGTLTLEVNTATGGITDGGAAAYSGSCGSLVLIDCDDSSSATPNDQPLININDMALAGQTIYFRVWEYGNNNFGDFNVSAYNANVVATNDLQSVGFNYYPNPVNDTLTMTANENITLISIFNMLGQEVKTEKLSTLQANIDMSRLATGTYFVKAQVGQSVGTFKIVKK